jgi:SRSO17 transposase
MTWPSGSAGGDGEQSGCGQYTGTAGRIENAQVAVYLTTPTATRS